MDEVVLVRQAAGVRLPRPTADVRRILRAAAREDGGVERPVVHPCCARVAGPKTLRRSALRRRLRGRSTAIHCHLVADAIPVVRCLRGRIAVELERARVVHGERARNKENGHGDRRHGATEEEPASAPASCRAYDLPCHVICTLSSPLRGAEPPHRSAKRRPQPCGQPGGWREMRFVTRDRGQFGRLCFAALSSRYEP